MRKHALSRPGIYVITRISDGKVYVGQARKVSQRFASHRASLDKGTHRNGPLQAAWAADGANAFTWELVCEPINGHAPEVMTQLEREVMECYSDRFNLMEPVQAYLGASDSTRQRLSDFNKARWADPAYKARLSAIQTERFKDPAILAERTALMREVHSRPEVRRAKSEGQTRLWQEEGRREARGEKTKAHWEDPDHRAKQTASRKGVWASYTPEDRQQRIDRTAAARKLAREIRANPMRSRIEVFF